MENVLLLFLCCLVTVTYGDFVVEKALHKLLLTDLDTDVRPSGPKSNVVTVHFDMKLQRLVGYNVKKQILTVDAFTLLRWNDPQLAWNVSLHSGTDRINVASSLIWTPDIVLYNTALEASLAHTDIYKTKVTIQSDGTAIWTAPVTWKISCSSDVTWFPIDEQTCKFNFGSWSYSSKQIKLVFWSKPEKKENLYSGVYFVDSGEWDIFSLTTNQEDLTFDCCKDAFSTIGYFIVLNRLSLYYFIYIILPLMSLSFLFLIIFHIPYDSGERMGFGVTVLLSITVYLLVISEKLPEKSDSKPMLGICFIIVFYILCIALGFSAMTCILPKRKHQPPQFLWNLVKNGFSFRKKGTAPSPTPLQVKAIPMKKMTESYDPDNYTELNGKEQEDYSEQWEKISRYLDKRFFFIFLFLMISMPFIAIMTLPTTGKA